MDCSPPGPSGNGISQARIPEWVPFPSPGDLLDSGVKPVSSASAGRFCFCFLTLNHLGSPHLVNILLLPVSHCSNFPKVSGSSILSCMVLDLPGEKRLRELLESHGMCPNIKSATWFLVESCSLLEQRPPLMEQR